MSTVPHIELPVGFVLEDRGGGDLAVVKSDERLTKSVSFRVTPTERAELMPFIDSFPNGSVTSAMRWLLSQPAVKSAVASRVEATRTSPPTPR